MKMCRFGHIARNCKNAVDPSFGEEGHEEEENTVEAQDGPSRY